MSDANLNTNELSPHTFNEFLLPPELLKGLSELGYTKPTTVQQKTFKSIKEGFNLIIQSHTGSGKTTAFCLPILAKLNLDVKDPQALVLVPTRELAKQVAVECSRLGYHLGIRVAAVYGGASLDAQASTLKAGVHVVIATPGRLKDIHSKNLFQSKHIKIVVLDEADEMLSMGFWDDVVFILNQLPKDKQTLLFSATVPSTIENAIHTLLKDPVSINLSSDQVGAKTIHHIVHFENEAEIKQRNLLYAIEFHQPKRAIVFCNTKDETDFLERYLKRFGFKVRALNGDMSQSARERVMEDIKSNNLDLLIATDIAARGIDISGLTHVFNYDLPDNDEVYIHRTGRTGRAESLGTAISLVRGKDTTQLFHLKEKFEIDIEEITLPPVDEVLRSQAERLSLLLTEEADQVECSQYLSVAKSMLHRADITEILAFLLRSFYNKPTEIIAKSNSRHEKKTEKPKEIPNKPRKLIPDPVINNQTESEFANLYITLGRNDGFKNLTDLVYHLSKTTGVDMGHFTGMGQVRDTSSHVEVDTEVFKEIIAAMNGREKKSTRQEALENNPTIVCEITHAEPPNNRHPYRHRRSF